MKKNIPFAHYYCNRKNVAQNNKIKKDDFNYSSVLQTNTNWRKIYNGTSTYMSWTEDHDK